MHRPACLLAACWLAAAVAHAQPSAEPQPLYPITPIALAELLARPVGGPVSTPRTRGSLDLKGRRLYIAEYRVLLDQTGEMPVAAHGGQVLGRPVKGDEALVAYRSNPDITTLQALVDRSWSDLQARLSAAGVQTVAAEDVVAEHGAIYEATDAPSTPAAPVLQDGRSGNAQRRYLVLAPTGMKLVKQAPGGLNVGDIGARVKFIANKVEAVSLALAVHLTGLDAAAPRAGTDALATATTLSPLMELVPAPAAALVHAHGQNALVNLTEALTLDAEFGRLRAAEPNLDSRRSVLDRLVDLGKSLGGTSRPRIDAVLELDGARTARLLMYSFGAANQAMADALRAAQQGDAAPPALPSPASAPASAPNSAPGNAPGKGP